MCSLRPVWFVLLLFINELVYCEEICKYEDVECMTRGAQKIYNTLTVGVKDLIEPIDPLHAEKIVGDLPTLKYETRNLTLTGLRNCTVELFKCHTAKSSFEYDLSCPKLILHYSYEAIGQMLSSQVDVNGKGTTTIIFDDYVIKIKGNFRESNRLEDLKHYLSITSHYIETELNGRLVFESQALINPDQSKSDLGKAAINENYKELEEQYIRSPFIETFITIFVQKFNTYLHNYPIEEVFKHD